MWLWFVMSRCVHESLLQGKDQTPALQSHPSLRQQTVMSSSHAYDSSKVSHCRLVLHHPVVLQVDPAIIGGLIIDIGEKHIDLSISSRIKKIEQLVRENV
jgi:hypothetical protein